MKKGQFYLFTALMLIVALGSAMHAIVPVPSPSSSFDVLGDNLKRELIKVHNIALYNNSDVNSVLRTAVEDYAMYARTEDANIGVLTVRVGEKDIYVINTLLQSVIVATEQEIVTLTNSANYSLAKVNSVNVTFIETEAYWQEHGNNHYVMNTSREELQSIIASTKGKTRQVKIV